MGKELNIINLDNPGVETDNPSVNENIQIAKGFTKPWKECQWLSQRAASNVDLDVTREVEIFICKRMFDEEGITVGIIPAICEQCTEENYQYHKILSLHHNILSMDKTEEEIIKFAKSYLKQAGKENVKNTLLQAAEERRHSFEKLERIAKALCLDI